MPQHALFYVLHSIFLRRSYSLSKSNNDVVGVYPICWLNERHFSGFSKHFSRYTASFICLFCLIMRYSLLPYATFHWYWIVFYCIPPQHGYNLSVEIFRTLNLRTLNSIIYCILFYTFLRNNTQHDTRRTQDDSKLHGIKNWPT